MSLTMPGRPLASHSPDTVNYRIDGPLHRIYFDDFPRQVRAVFSGETLLDTTGAKLLHESNLLPMLYVPRSDVVTELLEPTDRSTHCPFKGDASYWSVRVGDRVAEDAVWAYEHPLEPARWLAGYVGLYWTSMDAWFDEDEEVHGHLRDPYHRVDVRPSRRTVTVTVAGEVLGQSDRPMLLSETALPNRWYLPPGAVAMDTLVPSETHTHCPYKGDASYWSARVGDRVIADVAWSYPEPFDDARRVEGYLCFDGDEVSTEIG